MFATVSGIRIRDQGWVRNRDPDQRWKKIGSGINIPLWVKSKKKLNWKKQRLSKLLWKLVRFPSSSLSVPVLGWERGPTTKMWSSRCCRIWTPRCCSCCCCWSCCRSSPFANCCNKPTFFSWCSRWRYCCCCSTSWRPLAGSCGGGGLCSGCCSTSWRPLAGRGSSCLAFRCTVLSPWSLILINKTRVENLVMKRICITVLRIRDIFCDFGSGYSIFSNCGSGFRIRIPEPDPGSRSRVKGPKI